MSHELHLHVYQFLSRRRLPSRLPNPSVTSPEQEPHIQFRVTFEYGDAPFQISFLEDEPQLRPKVSIGASQFVDPESENRMNDKWPGCLIGHAIVTSENQIWDQDTLCRCMRFLNLILLTRKDSGHFNEVSDQMATVRGYRRAYFQSQLFDIKGDRRPSHSRFYSQTRIGDFVGPGLVTLDNLPFPHLNEMGWGRIIPFSDATDAVHDLAEIQRREDAIRLHGNSHKQLSKAAEYLSDHDLEGCIRSASSAVEARVKYCCNLWSVKFAGGKGGKSLPFNQKIERVLADAGKPSYQRADATNYGLILDLYKASSDARHEGACQWDGADGVVRLFEAARKFCIWIDSIV